MMIRSLLLTHTTTSGRSVGLLTATALMLSGCIGVFDEQPPRYNFVSGGKRAPLMNPGGAGEKAVESQMNASMGAAANAQNPLSAQSSRAPSAYDLTQMDGVPSAPLSYEPDANIDYTQQPILPETAPMAQNGPSPLYYYEQQQTSVAASTLADDNNTEMMEASPLAAYSNETSVEPQNTEFPQLASVPENNQALQESFEEVKQDAALFDETYVTRAPKVNITTTEAIAQEPFVTVIPNQNVALQNTQNVPDYVNEEVLTPQELEVEMRAMQQSQVQAIQQKMTQETPANPMPLEAQTYSSEMSSVTVEPQAIVALQQPPLEVYRQQPIQPVMQNEAVIAETSLETIVTETEYTPLPDSNVATVNAYEQQPQTYDPEANTVEVYDAPDVAAAPRETQLYTSNGPIRLVPPKPISQRPRLQRSRYSDLRRNYSRTNVYRHTQ